MRRLVVIALVALIAWLPAVGYAQTQPQAAPPTAVSGDFGLHPMVVTVAGAVTGIMLASAVTGSLITGALLMDGVPLSEALEMGTGLTLSAVAASAVLGGLLGHLLFGR
jgi:hypothetical protein